MELTVDDVRQIADAGDQELQRLAPGIWLQLKILPPAMTGAVFQQYTVDIREMLKYNKQLIIIK